MLRWDVYNKGTKYEMLQLWLEVNVTSYCLLSGDLLWLVSFHSETNVYNCYVTLTLKLTQQLEETESFSSRQ
jgi:hypothetical protein